MAVADEKDLAIHAKLGASWEGFALESWIQSLGLKLKEVFFWGTHAGAEIDLIWQAHGKW